MRRFVCLPASVLLCVTALGSDSPKEYDGGTQFAGIEGTWRLTEYDIDGAKRTPAFRCVLTCRDGTFTVRYTNDEDTIRGGARIDPARTPPHLDWSPSNGGGKGQVLRMIYQIDGDTLRTAIMNGDPALRPQSFRDKRVVVHTYKRVR